MCYLVPLIEISLVFSYFLAFSLVFIGTRLKNSSCTILYYLVLSRPDNSKSSEYSITFN